MVATTEPVTWHVGDISITRLIELEQVSDLGEFISEIPGATVDAITALPWLSGDRWLAADGGYPWRVQSFLVEVAGRRVIVDTGIGNDKDRALEVYRLKTDFLQRLQDLGWSPESVDAVVCTHLHVDHVGWNTTLVDGKWVPTFPNAKYYFVRAEYEHWRDFFADPKADEVYANDYIKDEVDAKAVYADSVEPVMAAGCVELIESDAEVLPGLRLVPSPGHTPGHACVVVESDGCAAVITGDCLHTPFQIAYPEWSILLDTDQHASATARQELVEQWAAGQTFIIGTHFGGPGAGHVVRMGDRWGLRLLPGAESGGEQRVPLSAPAAD